MLVNVAVGPCASGETTLAREVLGSLGAGMLLIADRGFYGFALWNLCRATGADLLWAHQVQSRPAGGRTPARRLLAIHAA
jgi:hypothetical protein